MQRELDIGVAVVTIAAALASLSGRYALAYEVVALLAVTYLAFRVSPTKLFTGKPSLLDDAILLIGFLLVRQEFVPETYGGIAVLVGGLAITGFAIVVTYTMKARKGSILGRLQSHENWQVLARAFALVWGMYALVYRPLVRWSWELPVLVILAAAFVFFPKRFPRVPVELFHTKRGFLLGLAGILVLHAAMDGLVAFTLLGYQQTPLWALGIVGVILLLGLPAYMWYKTYLVRKSHHHLPDWDVWKVSLVTALLVVPFFWPAVWLAPGVSFTPVVQIPSAVPFLAALGVFLVWYTIASLEPYLKRVLMVGPFLAGVVWLGLFAYYRFVTEFDILLAVDSFLALPVAVLVFVAVSFGIVIGYFSFLYELWRD